jgi:AGCS family alanine or glycine:cation symporter
MLDFLTTINGFIWSNIIVLLLMFCGTFFTIYLRFIQARLFTQSVRALLHSKRAKDRQISSFQALCTSLAQRVGTGNLAGVATAISYGGEGAIFWMWMTAIVGSSTAYAESTLAQIFKLKKADGSFYGGPAYYIHAGLKSKFLAMIFALSLVTALGVVFNGVQSNTIAQGLAISFDLPPLFSGVMLALTATSIIFGGKERIARVAEILVPIMALSYLAMTLYVVIIHSAELPGMLLRIITRAFSADAAAGGFAGYAMKEAFRYGVARGLFSNEAGFGSAPNAAATAAVAHPAEQGLVQMLAVYIDTLIICTSTAFLILLAPDVDTGLTGIALTEAAAVYHFGDLGKYFIALAIVLFGFTTILGNTFYGEANIQFLSRQKSARMAFRLVVIATVVVGSVLEVPLVWECADLMSAIMIMINLVSITLLARLIRTTSKHYAEEFLPNPAIGFSHTQIGFCARVPYDFFYALRGDERGE